MRHVFFNYLLEQGALVYIGCLLVVYCFHQGNEVPCCYIYLEVNDRVACYLLRKY